MQRESGFTLLEVIISLLLLSMVLVISASVPNVYQRLKVVYETKNIAEDYLEGKMEVERDKAKTSYDQLENETTNSANYNYINVTDQTMGRTLQYRITVTNTVTKGVNIKVVKIDVQAKYLNNLPVTVSDSFNAIDPQYSVSTTTTATTSNTTTTTTGG